MFLVRVCKKKTTLPLLLTGASRLWRADPLSLPRLLTFGAAPPLLLAGASPLCAAPPLLLSDASSPTCLRLSSLALRIIFSSLTPLLFGAAPLFSPSGVSHTSALDCLSIRLSFVVSDEKDCTAAPKSLLD